MDLRHPPGQLFVSAKISLFLLCTFTTIPGIRGGTAVLKRYEYALPRMGTEFRIVLYHTDAENAQKAALAAFDRVEDLEDIFSDYRERSETNRLCMVGVNKPWSISPELFFVIETSLRYSRMSGGAFDITVGPAVQLWRQARKTKKLPGEAELQNALRKVGYGNIVLDADNRTAMLKLAGMKLDFGAIAKGYAADQALEVLKSRGIGRAIVMGGGDMAIGAPPPDQRGWKVEIRQAEATSHGNQGYLVLRNSGVATSGDIFQFVEIDGRHYSHIINPLTGMAVTEAASATVVAPNGITADALSTTLCVLPPADGLKLVESIPGVSAMIVRRSGEGLRRVRSAGFPVMTDSETSQRKTGKNLR